MLISYNEACGKDCSTLAQDLMLCEQAGFDCIEIRLDMLVDYLKHNTVEDLAAFFQTSRLRPHAFNALYLYSEFLSEYDDSKRQAALLEEFRLGCEVGKAIGSHFFIIVPPLQRDPLGGPFTGSREDTFANCVRILTALSDLALPYEMNLCFELVGFDRSSVRSIADADAIIRAVDRRNVGFVFDSYNIFLNGGCNDFSPIGSVQPEKIFAAHLMSADDVPPGKRGQDKRRFCGGGAVDTGAFLQALKAAGYQGIASVETFRPEYWEKSPQWVTQTAYATTRAALEENGCLTPIAPSSPR